MVYAGLSQSCLFLEISSPMHTCPASKNTSISYKLRIATVITTYDEVLWWVGPYVCVSVWLSARISPEPHARYLRNFCARCQRPCSVLFRHVDDRPHRRSAGTGWRKSTARAKCNLRLPCLYYDPTSWPRAQNTTQMLLSRQAYCVYDAVNINALSLCLNSGHIRVRNRQSRTV